MAPSLTFAIPFYRDTSLLRAAIESVVAQRHPDWRLVVVDDSGMDLDVEGLVRSFDDDRMSYVRNPQNLGMVPTWNRCLESAETDLVNLLHADDALLPNYAELMLELAARHPDASAFFCESEIVDYAGHTTSTMADTVKKFLVPKTGEPEWILEGEDAVAGLMAGYFIMTPTLCYRKSRLDDRRFDPSYKQVQDLVFVIGLLMAGHTIVGARTPAYRYRRHADSATSLQSESMLRFDEEVEAFDRIAEQAEALGWSRASRVARRKRIIKLHLLYRGLRQLARLQVSGTLESLRYWARLL